MSRILLTSNLPNKIFSYTSDSFTASALYIAYGILQNPTKTGDIDSQKPKRLDKKFVDPVFIDHIELDGRDFSVGFGQAPTLGRIKPP